MHFSINMPKNEGKNTPTLVFWAYAVPGKSEIIQHRLTISIHYYLW